MVANINPIDRYLRKQAEVRYHLQLRPHGQGVHLINGLLHHPEWPRTEKYDEEIFDSMIDMGIRAILDYMEDGNAHPNGADVKLLRGDRMEVGIIE